MVSKKEIQKKYTDLKNRIFELNESYHRHDVSEVSDEKYDSLFKELIAVSYTHLTLPTT